MTVGLEFSWLYQIIVAGGGGAIVAFGLFRFFGKSWIEHQLAKNLEAAKSEISLLAARKMMLHDREYIVLPEVWSKLNKAYYSTALGLVSARDDPNFSHMSNLDLETWIKHYNFTDAENEYLSRNEDRALAFIRVLDSRCLKDAIRDFMDFYNYLQANRIFLSPDIKVKFIEVGTLFHEFTLAKKMEGISSAPYSRQELLLDAFKKYLEQAKPIMKEIEQLVQQKLFPETKDLSAPACSMIPAGRLVRIPFLKSRWRTRHDSNV